MDLLSAAGAAGASISYGLASVLQARGARAVARAPGVDPRLLVRVARSVPFLFGVALDVLGFVLQLIALRTLPLFLVQAAVAASLAVTALGAAVLLRERLGALEWLAVVAVCGGLALLGLSAGGEGAHRPPVGFVIGLAVVTAGLVLLAAVTRLLPVRGRTTWLGATAGLAFGVVALGARTLPSLSPLRLLAEPTMVLVLIGVGLGFLLYTTAMQGGSVTIATASLVVGETVLPAAVGVFVLGDRARPGYAPLAVSGFLVAVAGAVALARFGEAETRRAPDARTAPAAEA